MFIGAEAILSGRRETVKKRARLAAFMRPAGDLIPAETRLQLAPVDKANLLPGRLALATGGLPRHEVLVEKLISTQPSNLSNNLLITFPEPFNPESIRG